MPDSLEVIEDVVEILEIAEKGDPGESGAAPLENTDTLEVQLAATGHRISGLRGLDGAALVNPFTVLQAGGNGKWGVELPTNRAVQLYHQEADAVLADVSRLRYPSVRLFDGALSGTVPESWQYDDNRVFATITVPGGDSIQPDGTIDITFSEAVTGVTTVGDGTGTLEATDGTGFAPSVSTADNITWTLQPPVGDWIEGANIIVTISPTIAASDDAAQLCDGLGYQLTVEASAPDTQAPTMTGFVIEATSSDANIAISSLSATDDRAVTAYLITESAATPSAADPNWDSAANWIANGYDTGLTAGANQTIALYAWAEDAADNISTSLTDSCVVNIPAHLPSFSVQPTVNTALYDGATIDFTLADTESHGLDVQYWDSAAWQTLLTNVTSGSYAQTGVSITGLTPDATLDYLKLRVADTGTTDWVESNTVASFSTVAPTLSDVTAGDTQNTLTFADHPNDTADSFNIHWGTVSGSLGNTITGAISPYNHTGLTNDQAYFYEVVAVKGGVESLPSGELSGTPTAAVFATWDAANKASGITLSGGDLIATDASGTTSFKSVFETVGVTTGKYYAEITINAADALSDILMGVGDTTQPTDNFIGSQDTNGVGYRPSSGGQFYNGAQASAPWPIESAMPITIGIALDADARKFSIVGSDGTWDTSLSIGISGTNALYIVGSMRDNGTDAQLTLNTGASAFAHPVPSGYDQRFQE